MRIVALLALCLGSALSAASEGDQILDLRLRGAIGREAAHLGKDTGPVLYATVRRSAGAWERVWGITPTYNSSQHGGIVTAGEVGESAITLALTMQFEGDAWVKGGFGHYQVKLAKKADGAWAGTFDGDFEGQAISGGTALAERRQPSAPAAGFVAPAEREHPRLLIRAGDLPALKAKAETPFGKACLAEFPRSALGLGLLYRLTGDKAHADAAAAAVKAHMADNDNGDKAIRCRFVGWRLEQTAMAFDLCYDAWSPEFRAEVVAFMKRVCYRMFYSRAQWTEYIIWKTNEEYTAAILYAAGLAGLAMFDEPGPAPVAPIHPFGTRDPAAPLAASTADLGSEPALVPFASDVMPGDWLFAGGVKPQAGEDPIAASGGPAGKVLKVGDTLTAGGETRSVAHLPKDKDKGYFDGMIDVTNAIGRVFFSTTWFQTVIDNEAPRWVVFKADYGAVKGRAWLAGVPVAEGMAVRLGKGRYPLLIEARIADTNAWGRIMMRPRLVEVDEVAAQRINGKLLADHADRSAIHAVELAAWKADGGRDVECGRYDALAREALYLTFTQGMTEGGGMVGTSHELLMDGPATYAACLARVRGVPVTPQANEADWVPRKLMQLVCQEDGSALAHHLGGPANFSIMGYQDQRDYLGEELASLFPVITAKYRPTALWLWNRRYGVTSPEDAAKVLACDRRPQRNRLAEGKAPVAGAGYETVGAYAFVSYPLDLKPQPPAEVMPTTWRTGNGLTILRSGHDAASFCIQVHANTRYVEPVKFPIAGAFAVAGLGQRWTDALPVMMRAGGSREEHPVVYLPNFDHFTSAPGTLDHAEVDAQAAFASLTIGLDEVYRRVKSTRTVERDEKKKIDRVRINRERPYEPFYGLRRPDSIEPTGLSGWRAVAVDLSGRSGAPCLLAVADAIDDRNQPAVDQRWIWPLGEFKKALGVVGTTPGLALPDPQEPYTFASETKADGVTVQQNGFTIARGDATLRCVFVGAPVAVAIESCAKNVRGTHDHIARIGRLAITARAAGRYIAIITIARSEHPTVAAGADGTVKVGGVTLRLDGTVWRRP